MIINAKIVQLTIGKNVMAFIIWIFAYLAFWVFFQYMEKMELSSCEECELKYLDKCLVLDYINCQCNKCQSWYTVKEGKFKSSVSFLYNFDYV